jgi:hypothetical protein
MAGITQRQLAKDAGVHFKSVVYWEGKGGRPATDTPSTRSRIRQAFRQRHIVFVNDPAPGIRLMTAEEQKQLRIK